MKSVQNAVGNSTTEFALIDFGIVTAGPLERIDRQAVEESVSQLAGQLREHLPGFEWRFHEVRRDEWTSAPKIEPTDLLRQAREERDERGWDFVFVITASDLVSHYKPFALAVISSALDVALISTSRIDPRATKPEARDEDRVKSIRQRLCGLMAHSMGHWLGLGHHIDSTNAMYDFDSINEVAGSQLTGEQYGAMRTELTNIADQRLEEQAKTQRSSIPVFYVLASWRNRREILDGVLQAKPWKFPTRLSRLTTAAVSAVLVLLMTAETWDMAMNQTWGRVGLLFSFAIVVTTAYVAVRQQLYLRRSGRRVSEQIVTSNVSATAIVASGMVIMFLLLAGLSLLAGLLLFPTDVINDWAASLSKPIGLKHYCLMAITVGSLGIMIGALGASFEQAHYFRHVVFVDEEV